MWRFLSDQHNEAQFQKGVGCPLEYVHVLLGARFGHWPWEIEQEPADRVLFYRRLLSVEAEVHSHLAGVSTSDRAVFVDEG